MSPSPSSAPTWTCAAPAMSESVRLSILRNLRNDLNWSTLNQQRLSIDQGVGNLFMCRFEDPAESLAGNIHFFRGIGLVESFQIRQADRFELIDR
jgi:hypothetical protein